MVGGQRRRGVLKPEGQQSTEQGARARSAGTWELVGHAAVGALPSACGVDQLSIKSHGSHHGLQCEKNWLSKWAWSPTSGVQILTVTLTGRVTWGMFPYQLKLSLSWYFPSSPKAWPEHPFQTSTG